MVLEQNNTELQQKCVEADLRSDITRHFGIVFVELVGHSGSVLQIWRRSPSQLSVSLSCDFVLQYRRVRQICLYPWGKNCFYLVFPNLKVNSKSKWLRLRGLLINSGLVIMEEIDMRKVIDLEASRWIKTINYIPYFFNDAIWTVFLPIQLSWRYVLNP